MNYDHEKQITLELNLDSELQETKILLKKLCTEKSNIYNKAKELDLDLDLNSSEKYQILIFDIDQIKKKIKKLEMDLNKLEKTCLVCDKYSNKNTKMCYNCGKRLHKDAKCAYNVAIKYIYKSGHNYDDLYFCNDNGNIKECFNNGMKKYIEHIQINKN